MAITRVDPPFHFNTPLDSATCHFVWDQGSELDVQWGCFLDATGECWWWPNSQIRLLPNISSARYEISEIRQSGEMKNALAPHLKRQKS